MKQSSAEAAHSVDSDTDIISDNNSDDSNDNDSSMLSRLSSLLWSPETAVKRKHHLRAAFQSAAFVAVLAVTLLIQTLHSLVNNNNHDNSNHNNNNNQIHVNHRRLADEPGPFDDTVVEEDGCDLDKAEPGWLCAFYALGVLYMFLALAIACDEFFVPALEEMSSKRQLNLSMDVAGATLMAAGGSAPELFSALFGTFAESEIGFGTIIGSAVFNVLFVIAMCSLFSKETLTLTWWPLFRDSFCYTIGLVVLVIFVAVRTREEIELWEACVLLSLYFGYILLMWQNANLYKFFTGKEMVYEDEDSDDDENDNNAAGKDKDGKDDAATGDPSDKDVTNHTNFDQEFNADRERPSNDGDVYAPTASTKALTNPGDLTKLTNAAERAQNGGGLRWQGTFRAGILKLLRDPGSWVTVGGVGIVAKIAGDAEYVFKSIDKNGDGSIDKNELRALFDTLGAKMSDAELDEVFDQLDSDKDGAIGEAEFNAWYTNSKELIRSQVHAVFNELDSDKSGTLSKSEIRTLLVELDPNVTEKDVNDALDAMYQHGERDVVSFEEFESWYEKSILYERQKQAVEHDMEGVWDSIKPPSGDESTCFGWIQYIIVLPLVLIMAITIPDVRRPGWGKWCYAAFFLSIAWIGAFSYLMVTWTELIGNTLGIPSVIMGLTVLAAGTSVPDLLSSVIVARRGNGDMAVSSSIGSNIFDILVGLPIPWILFTAWPTKPSRVFIGADNIAISISLLIGMLVFVIGTIHCQGWKLTKLLAALMLWFYFGFLAQAIILEIPFETCS